LIVLLGLAAFAVSLVRYMPLRFAAHQAGLPLAADRLSGTVWQGRVQMDDATTVTWATDAGASLRALALVVNWRVAGPGTDLAGRVAAWPRSADIGPVAGRAAWGLVMAVMPGLQIRCDTPAVVAGLRLSLAPGVRAGGGGITVPAGTCSRQDGPPVSVPALTAALTTGADGVRAVLTGDAAPQVPLLTARLTNADQIVLTIHAAGAAMVPGMPAGADSEIELPLSALLR